MSKNEEPLANNVSASSEASRLSGADLERGHLIRVEDVPCPLNGSFVERVCATGRDFQYGTCTNTFTFRRMTNPDIVFLSPRPMLDELGTIYPESYSAFHFHKIRNPLMRYGRKRVQVLKIRTIMRYLSDGARIIDVGCGSGSLLRLMREICSDSFELWANDLNGDALAELEPLGIKLSVGPFVDRDIPDQFFDMVVMNQLIEHLGDPRGAINKSFKILKPGGLLFIETPCLKGLDYLMFKSGHWGGYHIPRHWTLFSEGSLAMMASEAGFKTEEVAFLASPSFWIHSFRNYFLDHYPSTGIHRFFTLKNPLLLIGFTFIDLVAVKFKFTSNMRMVFRRPAVASMDEAAEAT